MANIFPTWTKWLPLKLVIAMLCLGTMTAVAVTYYFTPKYTRVGYQPIQPVSFDHSLHVNQLGIDCRYCHQSVEVSGTSSVPSTQTCMTCHTQIKKQSPKLAIVQSSWATGESIPWVKIHKAPDYVYFNHAIHVNSGVSCYSCHGQINQMEVVWHDQPQSMGWCLECHRHPEGNVRPKDQVYNMDWRAESPSVQRKEGQKFVKEWNINPPVNCAACHR
jgi:hypothetical protein